MPYEVQESEGLTRKASVTVPSDEFEQTVNTELRKLSSKVKVRGFRKGKIPLSVLKQQYGSAVQKDVVENLVRQYVDKVVQEAENVVFVDQPNVTSFADGANALAFEFAFEVRPAIDPIGYLGVEIDRPKIEVESDEIDQQIENLRENAAVREPIEHRDTVSDGDVVTFDFEAVGDHEALQDFKAEDAEIIAGTENALPGINEALIGAKFGSAVVADCTPGDEFPIEDVRGETFQLNIKIKSVKRRVLPELDDDFAQDIGAETLLDLRSKIRESIEQQKSHQAGHIAENNLLEKLLDQHSFELPEKFLEQQINNGLQNQLYQMQQQGGLANADLDFDEMRESIKEQTENQMRAEFLLMAIAEKEALKLEEDDLRAYYTHQAMHVGVPAEQYARYVQSDPNRQQNALLSALMEKTVNKLIDEATVNETDWPTPETEDAKPKKKKAAKKKPAKKAAPKKEAKKKEEKSSKPSASNADSEQAAIEALSSMKADELKALCKENDLKVSGKKSDLIDRLMEAGVRP